VVLVANRLFSAKSGQIEESLAWLYRAASQAEGRLYGPLLSKIIGRLKVAGDIDGVVTWLRRGIETGHSYWTRYNRLPDLLQQSGHQAEAEQINKYGIQPGGTAAEPWEPPVLPSSPAKHRPAQVSRCTLGQKRQTRCSSDTARLRIRSTDRFSSITNQGCIQHTAEELADMHAHEDEDRVKIEIIGPVDATQKSTPWRTLWPVARYKTS